MMKVVVHVQRKESDKIAMIVYVVECAGSLSVGMPREICLYHEGLYKKKKEG